MDLVIFHYHLSPGGVSSVVRLAIQAVLKHSRGVSRIRLVTGRAPDPPLEADERRVEVHLVPQIDYSDAPPPSATRAWMERAQRLAADLLDRFASDSAVWWVHNYHLGKNTLFTQAILSIAASRDSPRMILQPHDFPEAGRFDLLRALDRLLTFPLYPTGPKIRYALINRRDMETLKAAGVPPQIIFHLQNPLPPRKAAPGEAEDRVKLKALLFAPRDAALPVLLYPVRAIRRKNVLEAGLLTSLASEPVRLLVTLPGVSRAERAYNSLVEGCFRSGSIAGELGLGVRKPEIGLDRLARVSDLLVSSSIQEGFGYLFAQALQWGLPLLARRLDVQADISDLFEGFPAFFYPELWCPLDPRERRRLGTRYRRKLRTIAGLIPRISLQGIEADLTHAFDGECVDFSLLDRELQARIVRQASSSIQFRVRIREANEEIAQSLNELLHCRRPQPVERIEERLGLEAFCARLEAVLSSFDGTVGSAAADPSEIQTGMRRLFAKMEYVRLLYD
jgi:glycosyltransferase involved in cell wall biosynthesis